MWDMVENASPTSYEVNEGTSAWFQGISSFHLALKFIYRIKLPERGYWIVILKSVFITDNKLLKEVAILRNKFLARNFFFLLKLIIFLKKTLNFILVYSQLTKLW